MQTDDFDLAARVIDLYRQHAPKALEVLNQTWAEASAAEIAKAAHALKSLSRNIGAIRVGEICDVIETDAREERLERSTPHLEKLNEALAATLEVLPVNGSEEKPSGHRKAAGDQC